LIIYLQLLKLGNLIILWKGRNTSQPENLLVSQRHGHLDFTVQE